MIDTLVESSSLPDYIQEVRSILELGAQQAPELILLGLIQSKVIFNSWKVERNLFLYFNQSNSMFKSEMINALLHTFIVGHQNSSFIIPRVWQRDQKLLTEGLVRAYQKDPASLSRVLDIAQELKVIPIFVTIYGNSQFFPFRSSHSSWK